MNLEITLAQAGLIGSVAAARYAKQARISKGRILSSGRIKVDIWVRMDNVCGGLRESELDLCREERWAWMEFAETSVVRRKWLVQPCHLLPLTPPANVTTLNPNLAHIKHVPPNLLSEFLFNLFTVY
jgi:hypothetical protein